MLEYYTPNKKGVKVPIGKKRVGLKMTRVDVSISMSNVLEVNTDTMSSAIKSLTGEIMKYNETGEFILNKKYYYEKVGDKSLFRKHNESIYFKV